MNGRIDSLTVLFINAGTKQFIPSAPISFLDKFKILSVCVNKNESWEDLSSMFLPYCSLIHQLDAAHLENRLDSLEDPTLSTPTSNQSHHQREFLAY